MGRSDGLGKIAKDEALIRLSTLLDSSGGLSAGLHPRLEIGLKLRLDVGLELSLKCETN